jgi:hypothetical protein
MAESALCLSPTYHSHFKLLETMKKLLTTLDFTPSVFFTFQGIYASVFLIFITTFSFSQNSKWEFGVGLRPLTLSEDPYSLILRKFISQNAAVRLGVSFIYKEKNDFVEYIHPYISDSFSYKHFYDRKDKNLHTALTVGIQYGKRKNGFYWYGATDISLRYDAVTPEIPVFNAGNIIKSGDFFTVASFAEEKTFGLGVRQSLGLQYYINSSISMSIEGGLFLERYYLKRYKFLYYATTEIDTATNIKGLVSGRQYYPLEELWLYNFNVSPLTILTFNYHF